MAYYQPNFQQYQPTYAPAQQSQGFNWVSGESGAKSWLVGRGETVLLMDSENPVFYLKSSDSAGMPLPLRIFDYTERTQAQNTAHNITDGQFVTREEFNALIAKYDDLKAMLEKETKNE